MNFFDKVREVFALAPVVASGVKVVEDALPSSPGKDKLAALLTLMTTVFGVAQELLPIVEKLAAAFVVIFKLNKSANAPDNPAVSSGNGEA